MQKDVKRCKDLLAVRERENDALKSDNRKMQMGYDDLKRRIELLDKENRELRRSKNSERPEFIKSSMTPEPSASRSVPYTG